MLQVSRLREAFADALNKVFAAFSKDASGLPIARLSLPREMAGCIKENYLVGTFPAWWRPICKKNPRSYLAAGVFGMGENYSWSEMQFFKLPVVTSGFHTQRVKVQQYC